MQMQTFNAEQIHRLLKLVADSPSRMDIDVLSHLLDAVVNGDPEQREDSIRAILSLVEAQPTLN